jgi:putative peptidoglycan lipid II flippase
MQQGRVMRAAALLMASMIISRLLGYVRDMVMYPMFGQGALTDAFTAAFYIPNFLYQIIIGGAISAAFIPVFSSYLAKDDQRNAWQVSDIVISWAMLLMGLGVVTAYIFTPQIMSFLVDGYDAPTMELTVILTRIMLLQPLFMALSGLSMGILHAHQHFLWPAIGSMLYNLFIVLGGALLAGPIEARWPGLGIVGFSVGVVGGAMAYFLVQIPALLRAGFRYRLSLNARHPGFTRLIHLLIPVLIGLSVKQINLLVNIKLASAVAGSVAALNLAQKFMNVPIYVFASAIAVAIFPTMTRQAALADMAEFKKSVSLGIRSVVYICIPSAIGLIALREPIIRLLFEFKGANFSAADTIFTGQALMFYCLGLAFYGVVDVLLRAFYALQNTVTPVLVSAAAMAANVLFSLILVRSLDHMGLALAYSLAGMLQCALLFLLLRMRIGHMDLHNILRSFAKTLGAGLVMGLAAIGAAAFIAACLDITASKTAQIVQLGLSMGLAVALFFGITYFMKMEESKIVIDMFQRRLRRKKQQTANGEGN